jgi:hypothetical protein
MSTEEAKKANSEWHELKNSLPSSGALSIEMKKMKSK